MSSAYYALFHAMCRNAADCLIGKPRGSRPGPAWVQVYRAVDHNVAKEFTKIQGTIKKFPEGIRDFAEQLAEAKEDRERADYDPTAEFTVSDVTASIRRARSAIESFRSTRPADRKAFAAFVAIRRR